MASPPRFPLFDGPSPLHPLPRFSEEALGGRVEAWVKREDLLPVAFGGNKLRNLEYLVGTALAEGCDTLITSGRRWSNHARLTAAAGAMAGLAVHLVLSGPAVDPPGPGI
ncbi:MAG TPA: pyridoxal-phosphate dependent enzyme, partial [Candidatus Limnocylindrales bacterium]|nr:pyridoxal-phosphate dependent enzyme [Candidatus Limnocylindrales bacterium]